MPPHVNLKEQQAPKPLAHGPMDVPARRVHSASARHVPESPLSPLQAVFWKRTMFRMPAAHESAVGVSEVSVSEVSVSEVSVSERRRATRARETDLAARDGSPDRAPTAAPGQRRRG